MPIKGMTTREDLKPQLARLGKIRKGGEKTGNKPGKDLDHFRIDLTDPDAMQIFTSAYPQQPKQINIVLFHDTVEENFPTWVEAWNASSLLLRSDGELDYLWLEGDKYKRGKRPHQPVNGEFQVGRLEFLIPELVNEGIVGSVTLETHSNHDLRHIANILYTVERERGTLRGAQFVMKRVQESISTPGFGNNKGKRSRTNKWLVKLQPPRKLFETMLTGGSSLTPKLQSPTQQLPAPNTDKYVARLIEKYGLVSEQQAIDILNDCGGFNGWPDTSEKEQWVTIDKCIAEYQAPPTVDTSTGEVIDVEEIINTQGI